MLWVLAALATLETIVVHLFLWLKWPTVALVLTVASVIFLLWLVRLIRSLRRCPHSVEGDRLHLRLGSVRTVEVPIGQVAAVRTSWASGGATAPGVTSLVLMAAPNRIVDLSPPVAGRRGPVKAVAISVDDAVAFDAALAARGIPIA